MRVLVAVLLAVSVAGTFVPEEAHAFGKIFRRNKNKPKPGPTPKPTSTPTPTPPPGTRYPGLPSSCQTLSNRTHGACLTTNLDLPPGTEWAFQSDLQDAINDVPRDAVIFDGDTVRPGLEGAYASKLVAYLNGRGICAVWQGDNLMYLRSSGEDHSEDIEFVHGRTRRPNVYARVNCSPADILPTTGPKYSCIFDSSTCNPTADPSLENFNNDLRAIVREIIAEEKAKGGTSSILDVNYNSAYFESGEVIGYLLKDDGYPFVDAVANRALARGYCIATDRWKSVQMKKGNLFSNHSVVHHATAPDPRKDPTILTKPAKMGLLNACKAYQVRKVDESNPDDWYACAYILDKWEDRCSTQ